MGIMSLVHLHAIQTDAWLKSIAGDNVSGVDYLTKKTFLEIINCARNIKLH